jgi:putative transposase
VIILPRRPRAWLPGAKYHITSRGIRKMSLFEDDEDRYKFLHLIEETRYTYPFILHTYCLMTNHIHLQLETINTSPSAIMSNLNTKYAKYFNKKYQYSGHVFDKRYNGELIDSADYELDVSKYIHLNPLKAGLVDKLEDYPWSSYRAYVYGEKNPLIEMTQIFSYFPEPQAAHYEQFVKAPVLLPPVPEFL